MGDKIDSMDNLQDMVENRLCEMMDEDGNILIDDWEKFALEVRVYVEQVYQKDIEEAYKKGYQAIKDLYEADQIKLAYVE